MRDYTFIPTGTNTWISWSQQFLHPLANDVKSLYDYWLYFSPNYEEIKYTYLKSFRSDGETNLKDNQLLINALNYRQYVYIKEDGIKAAFGTDIDLPSGAVVISNVMPTDVNDATSNERKDLSNYIIQYSSSADYYIYSIKRDINDNYLLVATYTPKAGEIYGNQLLLQIPSYFPRFYVNTNDEKYQWDRESSGMTFGAFNKDFSRDVITNQIQDKKGLAWQNFLELFSKSYITTDSEENTDGEEIIMDATYNSFLNKVDNMAIPSYTINIIENQKQVQFDGIHILLY